MSVVVGDHKLVGVVGVEGEVRLGTEADLDLVEDVDPERVDGGNDRVDADVELVPLDEERVGHQFLDEDALGVAQGLVRHVGHNPDPPVAVVLEDEFCLRLSSKVLPQPGHFAGKPERLGDEREVGHG